MAGTVRKLSIYVLAVLTLSAAPFLCSQSNNASIDGEITDPSGGVVPGANVTLVSKDTKETSTFVSDANGLYSFRNVVPGTYRYEWYSPRLRAIAATGSITVKSGSTSFTAPVSGQAVLYLKAQ